MIAFIFARAGSKGLKNKNILPFAGKPLLAWSIEQALSTPRITRVIVSTDSLEIAKIAQMHGAEVPFLRPVELASDESPEWDAWRHALEYIQLHERNYSTPFISIPVTAPLRLPDDISRCIAAYDLYQPDAIITITSSAHNPGFNMVRKTEEDNVELLSTGNNSLKRRQDFPPVYNITTVAYILKPSFVLQGRSLFDGRIRAVEIPQERSIDIDTKVDFEIAELLMQKRINTSYS